MSVRVTHDGNITKIEFENTTFDEFWEAVETFNRNSTIPYKSYDSSGVCLSKIDGTILELGPDGKEGLGDTKRVIYVISTDYSFYTVENNEKGLSVNRRSIHDLNNPYSNEDFWKSIIYEHLSLDETEKLYHIDDLYIRINAVTKDYVICNIKHVLMGSTVFCIRFFSGDLNIELGMELNNVKILLELAQQLIEEIKAMPNIDSILDISLFDIIPDPRKCDDNDMPRIRCSNSSKKNL